MRRPKSFLSRLTSDARAKERQEIEDAIREADELDAGRRLRAGDESALVIFIDRYGAAVYGKCWRIVRNERDAEAAEAATFRNLWLRFDSWDPSKGALLAWLLTVAKRCSIDTLRQTRKHGDVLFFGYEQSENLLEQRPDMAPAPFTSVETDEFAALIESAVGQIENLDQRMAFMLRHLEGFSIREVAEALDSNPATVRVWIWRATQTMARVLSLRRPSGRSAPARAKATEIPTNRTPTSTDDDTSDVVTAERASTDASSPAGDPAPAADGRSEAVQDGANARHAADAREPARREPQDTQ